MLSVSSIHSGVIEKVASKAEEMLAVTAYRRLRLMQQTFIQFLNQHRPSMKAKSIRTMLQSEKSSNFRLMLRNELLLFFLQTAILLLCLSSTVTTAPDM